MKLYCCMSVLSVFCNKTKWIFCLHFVVLFFVVLYSIFVFFCFFILVKKTKHNTNLQNNNAEEKGQFFQLAQLCSQILFLFLGWV